MSLNVIDLMSHPVVTLAATETLSLAEVVMQMARIRHLPVVDEEDRLVGLVTHRDLLKASLSSLTALSTSEDKQFKRAVPVVDVMHTGIESIASMAPAIEAAKMMKQEKIGCLPVIDNDKLVGIITEADFLDLAIRMLETTPPVSHAPPQQ